MAKLIVTRDAAGEIDRREVELTPLTMIGRHPESTIQIADEHVSKFHCQVVALDGGGFLLRDCQSRNGTWMRGTRVGERDLHEGDEFLVGATTFRLVGAKPPDVGGPRGTERRVEETVKALATHLVEAASDGLAAEEDPVTIARRLEEGCQQLLVRFNELGALVALLSNRSSGIEGRVRTIDETSARMGEALLQQERVVRDLWSQCGRLGSHLEAQEQRMQDLARQMAELRAVVAKTTGTDLPPERPPLPSLQTEKLDQVRGPTARRRTVAQK